MPTGLQVLQDVADAAVVAAQIALVVDAINQRVDVAALHLEDVHFVK